ncbi:hypothetical protein PHISCL_07811 [Aspergillus sclerotialis]|uniref:Trichodiene synthase n=1 Tax=Aspergillus sclerotialis TaxID=2070753 RepID=A0A3A2ZPM3_9EURO|nr:hypothetical protein PHISCL_07811 [Aspergillus sclerotialis]
MNTEQFPSATYCRAIVRFLDGIKHKDDNLTSDQRVDCLRHVHSITAEYFTKPLPRTILKNVEPVRLASVLRTASHIAAYGFPKVPRDLRPEYPYGFLLDRSCPGHTSETPILVIMNEHLPRLLNHYGNFCAFNTVRGTFDYFQGSWMEQRNIQCCEASSCFPLYLRRLASPGSTVGGLLFPAAQFDDRKLIEEISHVMAHTSELVTFINDLLSLYKEYNQKETTLVTNWCKAEGITMDQALERLTDNAVHSCKQILDILEKKDKAVLSSVRAFIRGYVTAHFCELRYQLREVYEDKATGESGKKFRQYFEKALGTGWVDLEKWTCQVEGFEVSGPGPKGSEIQAYKTNAYDLNTPLDVISEAVGLVSKIRASIL